MDLANKAATETFAEFERKAWQAMTNSMPRPEQPTLTIENMLRAIDDAMRAGFDPSPAPRVIQTTNMVDLVEDWSQVRSPGRAARRLRQGHRQNIRLVKVPKPDAYRMGNDVYVHPVTWHRAIEKANSR